MTKRKEVMLIITENCNLACSYCFEHYKTDKIMRYETAIEIIEKEANMDDDFEECVITLFGGEPFLEFELIKKIYEYIAEKKWKKKMLLFMTTNGTVLSDEIKQWLEKRKQYVQCGLSLDGTRDMHNMNRSDSFDDIDLDFFKKCWPHQGVKMTISKETLPYLAEGIIYIHKLGYKCDCNFAYGIQWDEESVKCLEKELMKLVDFYKENESVELCQLLNIKFQDYCDTPGTVHKLCGAGKNMKAYDINGNEYPCQAFSPISIGDDAEKFIGYHLPKEDIDEDKNCSNCELYLMCSTCYGVNYIYTGSISQRSEWLCKFFKLCVKASARIKLHRLSMKKKEELTEMDYRTLYAISKLMNNEKYA